MSGQTEITRRAALAAVAMTSTVLAVGAADAQTPGRAPSARSKVALVTGSSRGIGAATAKRLARDGYAVTVNCEKNRELAAGVVREIEAAGGRAIWVQADVSDPSALTERERALASQRRSALAGLPGLDVAIPVRDIAK